MGLGGLKTMKNPRSKNLPLSRSAERGTAPVISPIGTIYDMQTEKTYSYGDKVGKISLELYTRLQDIQYGRAEDKYNWCTIVL